MVLLHGIGSSRRAWEPVIPELAEHFDVLAVDLPGFGESAPLPPQIESHPAALAARVQGLLHELAVARPNVVGNSLGGWAALELAQTCPIASLTLLDPAGLWRGRAPLYNRVSLRTTRWLAEHATGLLSRIVTHPAGRAVVLGQTHGQPTRLTPDYARDALQAMASCPGFYATLKATSDTGYLASGPITAPVTLAFGSRDFLLLKRQSRHLDQLPSQTHLETLRGCGHVPMADDPTAVAALIAASARRASEDRPTQLP
jgi:pimeloyl-ACP methyl ester carboxylesterase